MGYNFVDLRLGVMDETDFGMPGKATRTINGQEIEVMTTSIPEWAVRTHEQKTLINFEELNSLYSTSSKCSLGCIARKNDSQLRTSSRYIDGCNW